MVYLSVILACCIANDWRANARPQFKHPRYPDLGTEITDTYSTVEKYPMKGIGNRTVRSPEHPRFDEFPPLTSNYVKDKKRFLGWRYAGMSEFPWIVDIRSGQSENSLHQNEWSVGNLISSSSVLTTCRAVADFVPFLDQRSVVVEYVVYSKDPADHKVMYSPSFLYLNNKGKEKEIGTRQVLAMTPHPNCQTKPLDFDLGIVSIFPLFALPPTLGYMPLNMTLKFLKNEVDYGLKRKYDNPCTIATWGRATWEDGNLMSGFMLQNYKIKVSAFFIDSSRCGNAVWDFMNCTTWGEQCSDDKRKGRYLCMLPSSSRNTLSVICDHHRGSPIICNGKVIGMVAKGVTERNCDLRWTLPFIAQIITPAFQYYTHLSEGVMSQVLDNFDGDAFTKHGYSYQIRLFPSGHVMTGLFMFLWSSEILHFRS